VVLVWRSPPVAHPHGWQSSLWWHPWWSAVSWRRCQGLVVHQVRSKNCQPACPQHPTMTSQSSPFLVYSLPPSCHSVQATASRQCMSRQTRDDAPCVTFNINSTQHCSGFQSALNQSQGKVPIAFYMAIQRRTQSRDVPCSCQGEPMAPGLSPSSRGAVHTHNADDVVVVQSAVLSAAPPCTSLPPVGQWAMQRHE
jgi:hypothetical protein